MEKTAKKPEKRWDTHVYLGADDRAALEVMAKREDRSITKLITLILRKHLASDNA